MSALNIMCGICNEFYKATDNVYSTTTCGHLFHQQCLFRWLARSLTCPQCRHACHRNRVHRVYLNFGERTALDDEMEAAAVDAPIWLPWDQPLTPGVEETAPANAIQCGTDLDGNAAYLARIYFNDNLLPAVYVPRRGGAYAPWNCSGHFLRADLEVLVDCECTWVADANGHVPADALVTGYTDTGENLYTGRAQYDGRTLYGKVHPSHRVLYMAYMGQEVNTNTYEVLVRTPKDKATE